MTDHHRPYAGRPLQISLCITGVHFHHARHGFALLQNSSAHTQTDAKASVDEVRRLGPRMARRPSASLAGKQVRTCAGPACAEVAAGCPIFCSIKQTTVVQVSGTTVTLTL